MILLMGSRSAEIPTSLQGNLVAATSSCIAIGTLSESEGPTRIILTGQESTSDRPKLLGFEGTLLAPSRTLAVYSVDLEPLLEIHIRSDRPHIRVFVDHPSEPEIVEIEAQ